MKVALFALVLLAFTAPAFAQSVPNAQNTGVTISTTSTQVLLADDLKLGLREYLMIQCTGGNACYCCIGTHNTCTTLNGTELSPAGAGTWILTSVSRANGIIIAAPAGDVACLTAAGTSQVVTLDY